MPGLRTINRIIVHCSASNKPDETIADVRAFHTAPPPAGRGWRDVGYHWFIRRSGLIEPGRPEEKIGAHCEGANYDSIGICLSGLDQFTEPQFDALRLVLAACQTRYPRATLHPHCEIDRKGKICPNFDFAPIQQFWRKLQSSKSSEK